MPIPPDVERLVAIHNKFNTFYDRVFPASARPVDSGNAASTSSPQATSSGLPPLDSLPAAPSSSPDDDDEHVHQKFLDFFYRRIVLQEPSPPPSSESTAPASSGEDGEVIEIEETEQLLVEKQQPQELQPQNKQPQALQQEQQQQQQQQLEQQNQTVPSASLLVPSAPQAVAESKSLSVSEPVADSTSLTISKPVTDSTSLTISKPVTDSTSLTIPEPVADSTSLTVPEPVADSTSLSVPEPVAPSSAPPERQSSSRSLKRPRDHESPAGTHSVSLRKASTPANTEKDTAAGNVEEEDEEEDVLQGPRRRKQNHHRLAQVQTQQKTPEVVVPPAAPPNPQQQETIDLRTHYIVVPHTPIPYHPRQVPAAGKINIVDRLWSLKFQRSSGWQSRRRRRRRGGGGDSGSMGSARVTLPCLPKNLAGTEARAQLLQDARAVNAIPLSTTYENIAEKINELNASAQ